MTTPQIWRSPILVYHMSLCVCIYVYTIYAPIGVKQQGLGPAKSWLTSCVKQLCSYLKSFEVRSVGLRPFWLQLFERILTAEAFDALFALLFPNALC